MARAPSGRSLSPAEQERSRLLVVTRRRATGLLAAVTVVFALSTAFIHQASWLSWVQATAVASMVGGLADWFAVTALFRRPLGLPIPHTAIVVERKDRFASTLGSFVQESFLSPDAVIARLRAARAVDRAGVWLADPGHSRDLAARATGGLVSAVDLLHDGDVHDVLDTLVRQRLDEIALAPVAGRALERLTREGRLEPVLDAGFEALSRYLRDHGADLQRRLGTASPWWVPGPVSTRLVHRLVDRSDTLFADMARDRSHPLRLQFRTAVEKLAIHLQTDPSMRQRGEEIKADFLTQPTVRDLAAAIWDDVKVELREQAAQPDSELRRRVAEGIAHTGERLVTDADLAAAAERSIEALVRALLTRFDEELSGLVTGTVARWDALDTSHRLELLLGPDLQYIRINGTVVGALAGLLLHAVASAA